MSNNVLPDREVIWLKRFFSPPNALSWSQVSNKTGPLPWLELVIPWLELLKADPGSSVVLPVFDKSGPSHWYAMASSPRKSAQLAEELTSFIGPSCSDFDGTETPVRPGEPLDETLRERFGSHIYRFTALPPGNIDQFIRSLTSYLSALRRRPPVPNRVRRPIGQIRADFDRALLLGDASHADALLEEFNSSGRIDAEARHFLKIRRHAGLGDWRAIATNRVEIESILPLSLPPQTHLDIIEALYRVYVEPVEADADEQQVLSVFREQVWGPYRDLFQSQQGIRQSRRFLRAFMLSECVRPEPDLERVERILSIYPKDDPEGEALLHKWRTLLPTPRPVPKDSLEQGQQAVLDGDYVAAVRLCAGALPVAEAVLWMIRCVEFAKSAELAREALAKIEALPEEQLQQIESDHHSRVNWLRQQVQTDTLDPGSSWSAWVYWVLKETPGEAEALRVLRHSAPGWSALDYRDDTDAVQELSGLLGHAIDESHTVLRRAFPKLYEFFGVGEGLPAPEFVPLYSDMVTIIGASDGVNAQELELASSLAEAMVMAGMPKGTYCDLVSALEALLAECDAVAHLSWALDLAELLALYPAPDPETRLRLIADVIGRAVQHGHRLTRASRMSVELLARDMGCEKALEQLPSAAVEPAEDSRLGFEGLIGIYTLTTAAGQRAREILQKEMPYADIRVNSDMVNTDPLRALARNADIFAFAWRSSAHQAYYAIKNSRVDGTIIHVRGKGSASLVQAIQEHLASLDIALA